MIEEPVVADTGPAARTRAEREALKLEKRLARQVGQAIADFHMIEA
ncbi:MAG TPA: tRNA 2-thiocytidine(32) synthetase TtcA, partial [Ottowia sp.]|nr:tRNA 2-thiocytidine(32) synthetase TtcA [Ottowia sp.]